MTGSFRSRVVATLVGLTAFACSSEPEGRRTSSAENIGTAVLRLVPVSGVAINSVSYVVTGTPLIPGTPLPSGALPTPGTASSFHFGVPVPVGSGYTLSLSAASAETGDDVTCTGAVGPFAITPNNGANISVTLTCRDNSSGQFVAGVDVKTDACPRLVADYAVAIPGTANVGSNIAVNALGHDLDGKTVTYAWSLAAANASVGSFAAPTAQSTSLACAANSGGDIPVTVTMSNGECQQRLLTKLACGNNDGCGNGVLDAGETCDPSIPAGTPGGGQFGCPADCTMTCGDGNVEAPAEQCELPAGVPTPFCTAQCRTRDVFPSCGDGMLTWPEVCDGNLFAPGAPPNAICIGCHLIIEDGPCGDGIISPGEECDPPSTRTCSDTCQKVATDACVACEEAGACAGQGDACLNFSGAQRASCYSVQQCITDTNCGDAPANLTSCFCGALALSACIAAPNSGPGAPAGACADPIRTAMGPGSAVSGSASNVEVLVRFIDSDFPGGAAIQRYNCDKADPSCLAVCGF